MQKKLYLLIFLFCVAGFVCAQNKSDRLRPKWISTTPHPATPSYIFETSSGIGNTLDAARQKAFINLTQKLEFERGLVTSSTIKEKTLTNETIEQSYDSRRNSYTRNKHQEFQLECTEKGKEVNLLCRSIDEYWEYTRNGYVCYVLYTIADTRQAGLAGSYDDEISLTEHYGARGFIRSLIVPGWGQFYKGSNLKGGFILGGTIASAVAIALTENTRADYIKKMQEKPAYKAYYNDKATQWETARNVTIGVAGALYVYNLIDAIATSGRRRVLVKKRRKFNYAVMPTVVNDAPAATFVMNF